MGLMNSFVVIVGYSGRMAQTTKSVLTELNRGFRFFSKKAPEALQVDNFSESMGVIDFSLPELTPLVIEKCLAASVPLVCGTTGFNSEEQRDQLFNEAAQKIPIVLDSNFSIGIELLCQASETLAHQLDESFFISDFHHLKKRDCPSGTALKIEARLRELRPQVQVEHRSFRMGKIAGEHRVSVAFGDERLELIHQANSRDVFAEGALRALDWLQGKEPGLYRMREVLK